VRYARTNDIWRKLFRIRDERIIKLAVEYRGVRGLGNGQVDVAGPIALFCGENGVGKSRLLKTVVAATGGPFSDFLPELAAFDGNIQAATLTRRDGEPLRETQIAGVAEIRAFLAPPGERLRVRTFDPTVQIPYLLHVIRSDKNFGDLYEGITPQSLAPEQLEELAYLVGRNYEKIEVFEIPDYGDHEITPYFRAKTVDGAYGAEDMGLGELALLFIYWTLLHIPEESILFLEEPESFIAPRSQRALIDLIAMYALDRRLFVMLTSHSGLITERVPGHHRDLVSRVPGTVSLVRDPSLGTLVSRLAILPARQLVLLVEDQLAGDLASVLVEYSNLPYRCDVLVLGSESHITEVLERLPARSESRHVTFIGLYDGDQRGRLPRDLVHPVSTLPSTTGPELMLQQFFGRQLHTQVAAYLQRDAGIVAAALAGAEGRDPHDWFRAFCDAIPMEQLEALRRLVPHWVAANSEAMQEFIATIERHATGRA
jgi:hypothetical protein